MNCIAHSRTARPRFAKLVAATLLLLPAVAFADDDTCRHQSQPRNLVLDTKGVRTIQFVIGHNDLAVEARDGVAAKVDGFACAEKADDLAKLVLTQKREGDKLIVRAERSERMGWSWGGREARMNLHATVPAGVLVQLDVGSGDAIVTGARALSIDLGSGDVDAHRIGGAVTASVGSGDIDINGAGSLKVLSIGSGDVEARAIGGDVEVGSIGSGDFTLVGAGGKVAIASIGSGDAELSGVKGGVSLGSIGSGDLSARDVGGDLVVRSKGSGSIDHQAVRGKVSVPAR